MKKQILLSASILLLLIGCKNEPKETPKPTVPVAEETVPKTEIDVPKTECYSVNKNGNLISMELNYSKDGASGTLNYALKEKDVNAGTFVGQVKDSILIAEYTFQSEGVESKRQIAYKLKGNRIVEGYGEMNNEGTQFKDVSKLNFDSKMPLERISCSK